MKALILVGGKGTRLYPLTYTLPKPLVPIVNRPFIGHMMRRLSNYGITEVVMSMCYLPDMLKHYIESEDNFGMKVDYVIEDCPLGTGGAIKNAASHFNETFMVFNGDVLTDLDLGKMIDYHTRRGSVATISLAYVDDPTAYGVIDTDDNGRILRFTEKPAPDAVTSHHINAGTYIFEPEILDYIPPETEYSLERKVYPDLLAHKRPMYGYFEEAYWLDIGNPEKYFQAHRDIAAGYVSIDGLSFNEGDDVVIGENAVISPTARITGPAYIGDGVRIMDGVDLGPNVFIGRNSIVDSHSSLKESILWENVVIGEGAVLNRAIIGTSSRIRPAVYLDPGAVIGCNERV
ncbi:MAG: NDP-sugar synthase [bacterium]|nr:NDP-sugar synthase [bacterium]